MDKKLKPVPADKQKSLGKLPTDVRNKMGYAQKGKMMKAKGGKMITYKEFVKQKSGAAVSDKELGNLKTAYMKKLSGAAISDAEMERLKKTIPGKAKGGEMKGYGAARTSGMGLQDENLIPGKSMDYIKDLI